MSVVVLLLKFGPWLLSVLAVVIAAFRHQQAKTATVEAGQKAAEA